MKNSDIAGWLSFSFSEDFVEVEASMGSSGPVAGKKASRIQASKYVIKHAISKGGEGFAKQFLTKTNPDGRLTLWQQMSHGRGLITTQWICSHLAHFFPSFLSFPDIDIDIDISAFNNLFAGNDGSG